MKYLKDEQYYSDLYDLITIKRCLEREKYSSQVKLPPLSGKKLNKRKTRTLLAPLIDFSLYFIKGDRYKAKASTIREWMENDRKKQSFLDSTPEPQNILCTECSLLMKNTMKELDDYSDNQMRVLFFFECPVCKKRKGVYNTGEIFASKTDPCDKCSSVTQRTYKRKGNIVTTIWTCLYCKFTKKESEDYGKTEDKWEKEKMEDKKLLEKYRSTYCLTETEGQEYIESTTQLKAAVKWFAEKEKKEQDPAYHKAIKLKKLSIVELEKVLSEILEKEKYIKLNFDKPDIDRYVIVPFTVQDANSVRKEQDSRNQLQKIIKKTLENTNWRLMNEGVTYRLGYLSSQLKGYEREEDLMKIVKKKRNKDKSEFIKGINCEKNKI